MSKETNDDGTRGVAYKSETGADSDNVDARSSEHLRWMELSKLPRTLMGGTRAMKEAGKEFLISPPLETKDSYRVRLENSVLFPGFNKTASFLAGQVFQVDIVLDDNVPENIRDHSKKIDSLSNDVNVFAKRVFQHGLQKGVSHIFVDAPKDVQASTRQEEIDAGVRPFFKEVRGEDLISAITGPNGLEQIRIKETHRERSGKFGIVTKHRIRVVEPGKYEVFEKDERRNMWVSIETGTLSITDKIPLFSFIPGEELSATTGISPLNDLAELNLTHWRSSSDQRNILHVGRVPFLFFKMCKMETAPVGVAYAITSEDKDASAEFVEIQGAAIEAGAKDLQELKAEMALFGLQQLIPRVGNQTATEKALTSSESNSSLGTWATEFESTLQDAFECFAEYGGETFPEESIKLNKEFNYGAFDTDEGRLILESVDKGVLSAQGAFSEMKRRGIYDENRMWDDNEDEIENEARSNPSFNLDGSGFFQNQVNNGS